MAEVVAGAEVAAQARGPNVTGVVSGAEVTVYRMGPNVVEAVAEVAVYERDRQRLKRGKEKRSIDIDPE